MTSSTSHSPIAIFGPSILHWGVDTGAGGSRKPPTELQEDRKVKGESKTPRAPANNPARIAVAPKSCSEPLGAWRLGARADDGHARPSLAANKEHVVKEAQQPTPVVLYLFSAVLLAIVLVSYSIFYLWALARAGSLPRSSLLGRMHDIYTYDIPRKRILSILIAPPNQIAQLFLADIKAQYFHIFPSSPLSRTLPSPPAVVVVESAVCESPHPFATAPPTSLAPIMANSLVEETRRIVAQFDYTDDDLNKGVQEFLRQMSTANKIS